MGPSSRDLQPPDCIGPKATKQPEFGLIPVRSPLLGESRLISSTRGTEMFHFPRWPPLVLCVETRVSA